MQGGADDVVGPPFFSPFNILHMPGQNIPLHLVVDEGNNSNSGDDVVQGWPGLAGLYNFSPFSGPSDFTLPIVTIRRVWFGVSEDLSGAKVYQIDTPIATIIGAGAPRVYQGTEIIDTAGHRFAFSEAYDDVQAALSACCNSEVLTAAFAFKQSNQSLDPNQPDPPCGAEAIFKWLAVLGTNPLSGYDYTMYVKLTSRDGLVTWEHNLALQLALAATIQQVLAWPADFIGLVGLDSVTLIANADVADGTHRHVSNFDGGTILMRTTIRDIGGDHPVIFSVAEQTFRLPDTDCDQEGSSDSSGE